MWMLLLVFWWMVTMLSLGSHSWKQTVTFRSRFTAAKKGTPFGVFGMSFPTRLFADLSGSIKSDGIAQSMLVEVYSTLGCKYCKKAKATLDELGVTYLTIDITPESGNADQMVEECVEDSVETIKEKALRRRRIVHARSTTVPQIYVLPRSSLITGNNNVDDDVHDIKARVGGCDDLLKEIEEGVFQTRLGIDGIEGNGVRVGVKSSVSATTATVLSSPTTTTIPSTSTPITTTFTPPSYLNQLALVSNANDLALDSQRFDALSLSKALQNQSLTLMDEFSSTDGSRVNYAAMRTSTAFITYCQLTTQLCNIPLTHLAALPTPKRLSFFVNLYNALILHANCVIGPPKDNPQARSDFFKGVTGAKYMIGGKGAGEGISASGHLFSPDDIEHGILRANYPHPSQITIDPLTPSFLPPWDPRVSITLPYLDPRIHFILNCGASSCPPIKILGDFPEAALQVAASAYLTSEIRVNNVIAGEVSYQQVLAAATLPDAILFLPRLLLWYGVDFGRDMPTRLARLLTMVPHPPDLTRKVPRSSDLTGDLTGEVGYDGYDKQYYAHACLTGFLRRYQRLHEELTSQILQQTSSQQPPQQPPSQPPSSQQLQTLVDAHIDYNVYNWTVNDISSS